MIVTIMVASQYTMLVYGEVIEDILLMSGLTSWLGRDVLLLIKHDDTEIPVFVDMISSMRISTPMEEDHDVGKS